MCETDFAAKSPSFGQLAYNLAVKVMKNNIGTPDELINAEGVKEDIDKTIYTLKENVSVRRIATIDSSMTASYMHQRLSLHIPVMDIPTYFGLKFCALKFDVDTTAEDSYLAIEKTRQLADKLAVQVFSNQPVAIYAENAPPGTEIDDILMEQEFSILGTSEKVKDIWDTHCNKMYNLYKTRVVLKEDYLRWECGEGIEKTNDFAEEVESLLKGE